MKKKLLSLLLSACMLSAMLPASAEVYENKKSLVESFEALTDWNPSGEAFVSQNTALVKDGEASLAVQYSYGKTYFTHADYKNGGFSLPEAEEGKILTGIGMWVYANNDADASVVLYTKNTRLETMTESKPQSLNFSGWQYLTFPVSEDTEFLYRIGIESENNEASTVLFDAMDAIYTYTNPKTQAISCNISDGQTGVPLGITPVFHFTNWIDREQTMTANVYPKQDFTLERVNDKEYRIVFANTLSSLQYYSVSLRATDVFGQTMTKNITFQTAEAYNATVVEGFENDLAWMAFAAPNAETNLKKSSTQKVGGSYSMQYNYSYERGEYGLVSTTWNQGGLAIPNSSAYKYFGFWVYGNSTDLKLSVDLKYGSSTLRPDFTTLSFNGWRYIEYEIGAISNLYLYEFVVKKTGSAYGDVGTIYIDDITVSTNSYYDTVADNDSIAGDYDDGGVQQVLAPTLDEVDLEPVRRDAPQTAQLGNRNPFYALNYEPSNYLPDSISGVSIMDGEFDRIYPGMRGITWATPLMNDGMERKGKRTTFSSGRHLSGGTNEWIMTELAKPETIKEVILFPRSRGAGYPVNFTIEVSDDARFWTTVKTVTGAGFSDAENKPEMDPVSYTFSPVTCRYVRINVSLLSTDGSASNYYLQLDEVEVINTDGENVGIYTAGAKITASNPLSTNAVQDYDTYMDDIIGAGAKWVNITIASPYSAYMNGTLAVSENERYNFKYLSDHGVDTTVRIRGDIRSNLSDIETYATNLGNAICVYVRELKDYVHVWQIFNEENFTGSAISDEWVDAYVTAVGIISDMVKNVDPTAKIEIETALIDRSWTKKVLDRGLGKKIDVIGIHVYKETNGADNIIENVGTFIEDGQRYFPVNQPYSTYAEELEAYKELVASYAPKCEVWCTEIAINTGGGSQDTTNLGQAKWLARAYLYHQMCGIGPTCWWLLHAHVSGDTEWGIIDQESVRKDAWYALRNVANTMNNDWTECADVTVSMSPADKEIIRCYENGAGVYQIPFWISEKIRDANTGRAVSIYLSDVPVENAVCIDTITGTVQELQFKSLGNMVIFENMVARDYPQIIRINATEAYQPYVNPNADKMPIEPWASMDDISRADIVTNTTVTAEQNTDVRYLSEGTGSLKLSRKASGTYIMNLNQPILQKNDEIPARLEAWVYSENDNGSLCILGKDTNGKTVNYDYKTQFSDGARRPVNAGWQKISFDLTNLATVDMIIWKSDKADGEIYIDDLRVIYTKPDDWKKIVMDSWDDYEHDWIPVFYDISKNEDVTYIKDGTASIRIDAVEHGEDYLLRSRSLRVPDVGGKLVPKVSGETEEAFGFWVYNVDAKVTFVDSKTNVKIPVTEPGWQYVEWKLDGRSCIDQLIMSTQEAGTLYVDALTVQYHYIPYTVDKVVTDQEALSATVTFTKEGASTDTVRIYLASYNQDGDLICVDTDTVEMKNEENGTFTKTVSVTTTETVNSLRAFVWNQNLTPKQS
ncbi:MAG: discoidin domain-containing protein [Ruminococcaceae bacterium]|nr:discoidin domain-containing protein [Oscillospiraceae bacterium]